MTNPKLLRRTYILLFVILSWVQLNGQQKRALLIGINQYKAPKNYKSPIPSALFRFTNLEGPVNDVRAFHAVLISRFHFPANQVDTLMNTAATRDAIIERLNTLLSKCNSGDYALIFYAGHGSQVINTLSAEPDRKDESIVPADAYKPGVPDIRDKELAAIFNRFLDKGVKLTVIMDCCHSGSLTRGPVDDTKSRFMPDAGYDAKDASQPIAPETRTDGSFLIIAASQDNEPAKEKPVNRNVVLGGFSQALLKALEQQSANASAQSLFTSIRAIIRSNGLRQEPIIAGSKERLQQTLFGFEKGAVQDKVLVAISGREGNQISLQCGFASGLYEENQLAKIVNGDTLAIVKVDTVLGVNKSLATLIKGDANILKPGEMLEIINWVSSKQPLLKVYVPNGSFNYQQVVKLAATANEVRQSGKVNWINSLEKSDPYTTIFFDGVKCRVNNQGKEQPPPKTFTAASFIQYSKPDSGFYFELPVVASLNDAFRILAGMNKNLQLVSNAAEAQYMLYGTIDNAGNPAYGLRRMQTTAADSLGSMPVQTRSFTLHSPEKNNVQQIADSLYNMAMKLAKIRGWLQLAPPVNITTKFPFHVEVENKTTGLRLEKPEVKLGDRIAFHLVLDSSYTGERLFRKFVYLFLIDKDGKMILVYPRGEDGNQLNQFPKKDEENTIVKDVLLHSGRVKAPAGTDNYFLLVTDEAIPDHTLVFNQEGVGEVRTASPLGKLLNMGNGATRSLDKSVSNWTVLRFQLKSMH